MLHTVISFILMELYIYARQNFRNVGLSRIDDESQETREREDEMMHHRHLTPYKAKRGFLIDDVDRASLGRGIVRSQ